MKENIRRTAETTFALYVSFLSLMSNPAYSQSTIEYISDCNAGNIETKADLAMLRDNLPLVAFVKETCRKSITEADPGFAAQIALLLGDSDFLLSELSEPEFEELVQQNYSFGNRSAFVRSEKTVDFYIQRVGRLGAAAGEDTNILGFLGSTSPQAFKQVAEVLPLAQIMMFTQTSGKGLDDFVEYCLKTQCKPVREGSEFCAFSDPVAMKFDAVSNPVGFWQRLRSCGEISAPVTAKLRVLGILDGRCSFALQQDALRSTDSVPALTCRDQLKRGHDISAWDDLDGFSLLALRGEDQSMQLFRLPEYRETSRKLLTAWPGLADLLNEAK